MKIYLGYYPFYPHDDVYIPYYQLADKYNIPIVFHTGECYSEKAKVKYSHPLNVDEIAMRWDNVTFIMAHMGEPWLLDAAMVIRKNKNVYADMSGIIEGKIDPEAIKTTLFRIQSALEYCNFERIIYGSDWPLAPMRGYLEAMRSIIPKEYREKIFYQNAIDAFKLTPEMLNPQPLTSTPLPTPVATTPTATPAPAVTIATTEKK
jgi:predicted TIM-barrel fold metal-dependent hydrolase